MPLLRLPRAAGALLRRALFRELLVLFQDAAVAVDSVGNAAAA